MSILETSQNPPALAPKPEIPSGVLMSSASLGPSMDLAPSLRKYCPSGVWPDVGSFALLALHAATNSLQTNAALCRLTVPSGVPMPGASLGRLAEIDLFGAVTPIVSTLRPTALGCCPTTTCGLYDTCVPPRCTGYASFVDAGTHSSSDLASLALGDVGPLPVIFRTSPIVIGNVLAPPSMLSLALWISLCALGMLAMSAGPRLAKLGCYVIFPRDPSIL
ncbi:hypothetical protein C8R44DRAFT_890287 [Mycena epipterygia]|nr:hypothetical protein C8R44DRAFT_890287 [Mycena epipterygia]